jgi:hypothetical protein
VPRKAIAVHDAQERTPADDVIFSSGDAVVLTTRLPAQLAGALFAEAAARGVQPSEVIALALRAMLEIEDGR